MYATNARGNPRAPQLTCAQLALEAIKAKKSNDPDAGMAAARFLAELDHVTCGIDIAALVLLRRVGVLP